MARPSHSSSDFEQLDAGLLAVGVPSRSTGRKEAILALIRELTLSFLNLPCHELDAAIEDALGKIGAIFEADRVYVFDYDFEAATATNTHEWCADGIAPQREQLQDVPMSACAPLVDANRKGETVRIPAVNELPAGPMQELLAAQEIRSLIALPLMDGERCRGMVGLDAVRRGVRYGAQEEELLRLFSELLVGVRRRARHEAELELQDRLLRESEARFCDLVEQIPSVAVQGYDVERRIFFWNRASEVLYGYRREEVLGRRLEDVLIHESVREQVVASVRAWMAGGPVIPPGECLMRHRDGRAIPVFSSHVMQEGPQGLEFYCLDIDLSEQKAAAQRLQQAASVFEHASDGILITDAEGSILDVNAAFSRITGYSREEVLGKNPRILKSGRQGADFYERMWKEIGESGSWQGEVWNGRKDGAIYPEILTINAIHDARGATSRYVAIFSDISARKKHEQELEFIAFHDALTGLPNRALLTDRLQQAMVNALAKERSLALVYLDIDDFKEINDTYGHDLGDEFLLTLAARFRKLSRPGDTVARLGGDEYALVLVDLEDIDACVPLLERLLETIAEPMVHEKLQMRLSASMGVSVYPQADPIDAEQLLRQADQAMYQAKVSGRSGYRIFDIAHDRALRTRYDTLQDIRRALGANEFELHYQPKVDMREGRVVGVEALLRWRHPRRGLLAPDSFLPSLRNDLLMIEVGDRVIELALAQAAAWREADHPIPISVNVDARQLEEPDFVAKLRAALGRHPGARAGDLEIEVLETGALEESAHSVQVLQAVREMGIPFSLDDFGTGYSSLVHLKQLPIDTLKIDQGFVRNMLDDPEDLAILDGVIGLAEAFRCEVIAEGVETEEHGELLLRMGCTLGQGYAIARPMSADQVAAWCATWTPHASWQRTQAVPHERLPLLFGLVEHRAWFRKVRAHLHGQSERPPLVSPERFCTSGRLEAASLRGSVKGAEVCALQERCIRLHGLARALCDGVDAGRVPTAAELDELEALHVEVKTTLRRWSEGLEGARRQA